MKARVQSVAAELKRDGALTVQTGKNRLVQTRAKVEEGWRAVSELLDGRATRSSRPRWMALSNGCYPQGRTGVDGARNSGSSSKGARKGAPGADLTLVFGFLVGPPIVLPVILGPIKRRLLFLSSHC